MNANEDLEDVWQDKLCPIVVKILNDSSERCREIATEILILILEKLRALSAFKLCSVFPVLNHRLSNSSSQPSTLREPSEEVRFLLVTLLNDILKKSGVDCPELRLYLDDIVGILKVTILDPFANVKKISCEAVIEASKAFKTDFHMIASSLLEPLTKCLGHQQNKVRLNAIKAIGSVMVVSRTPEDFKKVVSHLAQRLFDPVASVRLEVSVVAHNLLINWPMAYSNCAYIMPLLLTR